jgi:hypothetical protein
MVFLGLRAFDERALGAKRPPRRFIQAASEFPGLLTKSYHAEEWDTEQITDLAVQDGPRVPK